jgi:hypothetical protein
MARMTWRVLRSEGPGTVQPPCLRHLQQARVALDCLALAGRQVLGVRRHRPRPGSDELASKVAAIIRTWDRDYRGRKAPFGSSPSTPVPSSSAPCSSSLPAKAWRTGQLARADGTVSGARHYGHMGIDIPWARNELDQSCN